MSAIDQADRRPILTVAANMKPRISKPHHKTRWWITLAVTFTLATAAAWPLVNRVRVVQQALPQKPDLSSSPAALIDEITTAETSARSWGFSNTGLERLAELYHANSFSNEALACYRTLAKLAPRDARWPHLIANLEASFGRIDQALPWQRKAAELAPENFIVHLRLGDFLFKDNAIADAEKSYSRAHQIAPANPYVLLGMARCALRREDISGARALLRQTVEAQSDFVSAWALLASVETQLGNEAAATQARILGNGQFRELVDPWLSFLTELCYDPYQLSVAAAVAPDSVRARQLLEKTVSLAPDVASYRWQLAKLLIRAHENALARQQLEKAVTLAPDDAEAWSSLITLLIDTNDGRAAVSALMEGLRNCPQSGFLHFTNGRRLAALSHPAEAEAELKLSKRLQPAETRAYIELSSLYVQAGRLPEALDEVQSALTVAPADITLMGMLAELYIMQGDEAEAIRWSKKILASPKDESSTLNQIRKMFLQQFARPLGF